MTEDELEALQKLEPHKSMRLYLSAADAAEHVNWLDKNGRKYRVEPSTMGPEFRTIEVFAQDKEERK